MTYKGKNSVAKWVLDVAIKEAERQAQAQSDDISARCYNETIIAMHQTGLSPKTINRVIKYLTQGVIPKLDDMRAAGRHEDAAQNMLDSDQWAEDYCTRNGLPHFKCSERGAT